jgi:hypothetical protein
LANLNVPAPKKKVPVAVALLAVAPPVPVMILLALLPGWLQPGFCPDGTLVAGHLLGAGIVFGLILSGTGLLLAGIGYLGRRNPELSSARQQKSGIFFVVGLSLAALSSVAWLDGLFSYYCATPQVIVVHPDPFLGPVTYTWSDVRRVFSGCSYGRGGMSVEFGLDMKDGRRIGLGGDSWHMLAKNYALVGAILQLVPYVYDNEGSKRCPLRFRQLFSERPGGSGGIDFLYDWRAFVMPLAKSPRD